MAIIVEFIKQYAPWIYGACALAALWYLRGAILARRERRFAVFNLEKEAALNRTYGGWTAALALIATMGLVYLLSTVISDAVEPFVEPDRNATPEPVAVASGALTPSPTLPLPETTPTATATQRPRPTRRPTETPHAVEPTPTQGPVLPRCPDPRAIITAPGVGATVGGMVPVAGTAAHEAFDFYKLEYGAGENPSVWSYFDGGDRQVRGGNLGVLNAGALAPGVYSIRIVVVDSSGNFPPPCQTTVVIR